MLNSCHRRHIRLTIEKGFNVSQKREATGKPCYRCAEKGHKPEVCRFKDVECHVCKKKGHIAKACRCRPDEKKNRQNRGVKRLEVTSPKEESPVTAHSKHAPESQDEKQCDAPQHHAPPEDNQGRKETAPVSTGKKKSKSIKN